MTNRMIAAGTVRAVCAAVVLATLIGAAAAPHQARPSAPAIAQQSRHPAVRASLLPEDAEGEPGTRAGRGATIAEATFAFGHLEFDWNTAHGGVPGFDPWPPSRSLTELPSHPGPRGE